MKIEPSVLSADFWNLGEDILAVQDAGADTLHFDVMDGTFVANISFGTPILRSIRAHTDLKLDVHLMVTHPLSLIKRFCEAGADRIGFHVETVDDIDAILATIKDCGKEATIVVKPNTPIETVFPYLDRVSMVLVMTVEPGFGGQRFIPEMLEKVKLIKAKYPHILAQVDGGIHPETIGLCREAGVDICVAGSGVFSKGGIKEAIEELYRASQEVLPD